MKIAVLIARIFMGLIFFAFGLDKIHHFIPAPMPTGDAGTLFGVMFAHHWILFYGFVEAASGLMLLAGRFVPLALTLLAGMIVNIMLFSLTLGPPSGAIPGFVVGLLEIFLVYAYRAHFAGIFDPRAQPAT
jgi:putative oxidoreductase